MNAKRLTMMASATLGALAISASAFAQLAPADLAKLGTTLTPMGAEKAGNAAGTIPAWDGGITKVPAGINFKATGNYRTPSPVTSPCSPSTPATWTSTRTISVPVRWP